MKILEITPYLIPDRGGIQNYVYNLSKYFMKIGNKLIILTSNYPNGQKLILKNGIKIYRIPLLLKIGRQILISPKIIFKILNADCDVIHIHDISKPFYLLPVIIGSILSKKPILLTIHNKIISYNSLLWALILIYNKIVIRFVLKISNSIVISTNKLSINKPFLNYKNKISIIHPGVSEKFFVDNLTKKHKKYKIMLFIGKISKDHKYKGFKLLLNSFYEAQKEYKKIKLILIGDGNYINNLRTNISLLSLDDKVEILRNLSDNDLLKVFKESDLFILPSIDEREGWGMVASEALSLGIPVIVSNRAGISEFISKNKFGTIISPNVQEIKNAILRIINNYNEYENLSEDAALKIRDLLSWKVIVKKYQELMVNITR
jgi:glycosyltransferase involved in cell wall biosynthesis